ncbi:hypothetical protein ABW365_21545 [Enterococcus avium]
MPTYQERKSNERKEIIFHLLENESSLIQKEILVSEAALTYLIRLKLPGNIGELAGMIKQTIAGKIAYEDGKNISRFTLLICRKDI